MCAPNFVHNGLYKRSPQLSVPWSVRLGTDGDMIHILFIGISWLTAVNSKKYEFETIADIHIHII